MRLVNFHTHCFFCDGEGEPESFVEDAIRQGFSAIGFSSHAPLPFYISFVMANDQIENYCTTINSLKEKYRDQIEIYMGLEIDYVPGVVGPRSPQFAALGLDYTIGSIHLIQDQKTGEYFAVDENEKVFERILFNIFDGDMQKFGAKYFSLIRAMLAEHKPDIVGHLDLLKKLNKDEKYFREDEAWYQDEVMKTLAVIAKSDCVVEVNTGGISRGYTKMPYPSIWILHECKTLNIPVILNSDAHVSRNLATFFTEAVAILKEAGYTEQRILDQGKWTNVSL